MILSGNTYRCSGGETFDSVALHVYGNEKYSCDLLNANPALCRIPVFTGGETLALPVVVVPEEDDNGVYSSVKAPWKE